MEDSSNLRSPSSLALRWSAEEVAWRWKRAWPELCDGQWISEPTDAELDALLAQPPQLDRQCTRLGTAERVLRRARGAAQQRFHGVRLCRELFAAPTSEGFT